MPVFEYQCYECGLRFERVALQRASMLPCQSCGKMAKQRPPSSISSSYEGTPRGLSTQATGVSSFDHNVDRIIGSDSKKKWELINRRSEHKRSILEANPGTKPYELSKTPVGDYRVMSKRETQATINARVMNVQAIRLLKATKNSAAK